MQSADARTILQNGSKTFLVAWTGRFSRSVHEVHGVLTCHKFELHSRSLDAIIRRRGIWIATLVASSGELWYKSTYIAVCVTSAWLATDASSLPRFLSQIAGILDRYVDRIIIELNLLASYGLPIGSISIQIHVSVASPRLYFVVACISTRTCREHGSFSVEYQGQTTIT